MGIRKYNTEEERLAARRKTFRESQRRWREQNPDANRDAYKRWRNNNPDYFSNYYTEHKEERATYDAERRATQFGRASHLLGNYRYDDNKYNRGECTIDAQWIVDNVFSGQCCVYCGESDWTKLGVDRKDSSLPHTPENCVPCCKSCNCKKCTTPYDEFMRRIGKIA